MKNIKLYSEFINENKTYLNDKNMLRYRTTKVIDLQDWDKLVRDAYKKPYNLQQQDGCMSRGTVEITVPSDWANDDEMHDSIPEEINGDDMGVKFSVWLARDPKEWNGDPGKKNHVDMFWDRNFYPDLHTLANDLYDKGLIEAGDYSIKIDW